MSYLKNLRLKKHASSGAPLRRVYPELYDEAGFIREDAPPETAAMDLEEDWADDRVVSNVLRAIKADRDRYQPIPVGALSIIGAGMGGLGGAGYGLVKQLLQRRGFNLADLGKSSLWGGGIGLAAGTGAGLLSIPTAFQEDTYAYR